MNKKRGEGPDSKLTADQQRSCNFTSNINSHYGPTFFFFFKFFFSIFQKPQNRDLFKNLKITQLILLLKKKMFKVSVKWRQVKIVRGRGGSMTLRLSDYTDMAFDYSEAALNVTY